MAHVFVSYSRENKRRIEQILSDLHRAGHTTWYDKRSIQLGEEWRLAIDRGIADSDVVVLALSAPAAKSKYVCEELQIAYRRHKPLFPLILEPMSEENFPDVIRRDQSQWGTPVQGL